ncbi:MAG: hypothetical protein QXZ20_00565 [Candidatus Aenigmatarchaeota archaeon]
MIFEIIGIFLISLGLFGLHQAIEKGKDDKDTIILLVISLIIIFVGGVILIGKINFEVLIKRILGIFCVLFGFFLFGIFPGAGYTPTGFKNVGIFFGFLIFVLGIYFIFFS